MKKFISAVTAAAIVLSLTSCGNDFEIIRQDKVSSLRFSWWGKDAVNECTLSGLKTFENLNDNISVRPEYSDFDSFKTRMDVEFYSNTEADVMQLNYNWLSEYSENSDALYNLYDLSEYIDLDNFSSKFLSYGTKDGKLNGIPLSLDAVTFYYNKTLFDSYGLELPETWEDLFQAADVMKSDEVYPLNLSKLSSWMCCAAYAEQITGKKMYDENDEFQYNADDLKLMLDFYISLVKQKVTKRSGEFNRQDFQNCITGGIAVWIADAKYYYTPALEAGYDIAVGSYPNIDSAKSFGWYFKPSAFYSIKSTTETPEAAAKLVDYLLNSEEMTLNQGTSRGVPISKSAVETLEARDMLNGISIKANEKIKENNQMSLISPMLENEEVVDMFASACDNVYFEKINSEQAARNLYNKITDYYATR